ncbi:DnaJ protein [Amanita rubescens]|nr:DnaJ protein [Amanita rubescens]
MPRLSHRFSSFLTFYFCSPHSLRPSTRAYTTCRSKCLNPSPRPCRIGDKRALHATAPLGASHKDPYQVLGLKKDASPAEIKKTYFSLARKYHPDTNPDKAAREKFIEIQEAYDILKDEKKRAEYDKYGAASQQPGFDPNAFSQGRDFAGGFAGGFSQGFPGFGGFNASFGGGRGAQSDLFEQLFSFGGGRARSPFSESMRGADLETTVNISFQEAARGASKKVNITPIVNCPTCSGSGMKKGAKRLTCTACGGTGHRTFVIDSGFQMASTCNVCGGVGSTIPRSSQCLDCDGVGKVQTKKTVTVTIPAGVEEGMTVRIQNAGDAPASGKGQTGDLLVRIHVATSKMFTRQGANLYHKAQIPLHTAILGGRVRIPTLDGEVDVRLPGGTQQGEEMVLKGRGISPSFSGATGDLFVTFNILLPRSLTIRQRELLQAYADDVEGLVPPNPASKENVTSDTSRSTSDNGRASFANSSPNETWLSRTWKNVKGLLGF